MIDKLENGEISVDEIVSDLGTMMEASVDTTNATAEHGFLLLAKHPDVQQRVHEELVAVMARHNLKEFAFSMLSELHVFRAFIHEILRISCVAPTGGPHVAMEDHELEVGGKRVVIPKWTVCHSNALYIQKWTDWKNGNKALNAENNSVRLEYWLDDHLKFKMNDNLVVFGFGRRDCAGKSLALKTLYAVFGIMMTRYSFIAPHGDPDAMHIRQSFGLVLSVNPPIGIRVQQR